MTATKRSQSCTKSRCSFLSTLLRCVSVSFISHISFYTPVEVHVLLTRFSPSERTHFLVLQKYGELRDIQRQVLEIHLIASETCGADPLDNETTAVTLFEDTSPSCDERMREEVDAVHRAHVACRQVWDGIKDSLEPYKDIPAVDGDAAHYSNLPALFSELENLWNRRNAAGRAYDAAWETWSMDEDAARVSCGYADNYRKLKASISTDLTDKFKPDMKQIQSLCDEMPTDEAFTYSKTAYTADQPTSAHRSLHSTPGTIGRLGKAACQDMIDYTETTVEELSLQGISRSACLDHHCRMDKGKLDKTTLHIRDKYTTWKQADDIFRKGHAAYVVANDKYAEHLMMLEANNLTLNAGLLGLHFAKKGVDHAMDLLKITAACPASSICCVEPKEIPEICGKGKVDDVHSVTFELSPPSPPPPSPPPSPPAPNPPAPSPPSPPPTPSPSTPPAPPPSPSTPSDDSSSLPTSSEDFIQSDDWTGVIGAESPPPTLPSMPRSPPTPPDWPSIPDLPPASENPIRSDGWIGVLGLSPSPPPASPLSSPPPWPPRSRSTPPDDYAPPDDLSLPPPPSRDPDDWFDIRISGSKNTNLDGHDGYYAGRIEIRQYKDGVDAEWRTVCSRGPNGEFQFTDNDAKVACRMLGFATKNSYHFKGAFWGEGRSKNIYRGPRCKGNELNFAQCLMDETPIKPSSTCGHDGDVGIVCTVRSHPVGCDDPHCKGGDGVS